MKAVGPSSVLEHIQYQGVITFEPRTLKIYGHWGKPFIVFPSSRGRYFDYEGMGMIEAVAGFINSPLSYLAGMDDPWYLDLYRRSQIIVCVGQGAWEDEAIDDTHYLDL